EQSGGWIGEHQMSAGVPGRGHRQQSALREVDFGPSRYPPVRQLVGGLPGGRAQRIARTELVGQFQQQFVRSPLLELADLLELLAGEDRRSEEHTSELQSRE